MASYLPFCEPPRHKRQSLIFSGLPPAIEHTGSTAHVSGSQPQYYGRDELAKLCANWLMGVFGCPDIPEPPETNPTFRPKPLKDFIMHILRRLHADPAVTFCALYTLDRLKEVQPKLGSKSGHALFFAAIVVAGKVLPDTAYNNKDLAKTTEGMFPLRVTNHMERNLLENLKWVVRPPDVKTARAFEEQVRARYSDGPKPWIGPSRGQQAASMPVVANGPHNHNHDHPYSVQPRRPAESPTHQSSQPQHTHPIATIRPPVRAKTVVPVISSASQSSKPVHRHPWIPPELEEFSDSRSATPSPITPEECRDPRAWRAGKPRPLHRPGDKTLRDEIYEDRQGSLKRVGKLPPEAYRVIPRDDSYKDYLDLRAGDAKPRPDLYRDRTPRDEAYEERQAWIERSKKLRPDLYRRAGTPRDHSYVRVPGDASFGSVAPRNPRTARVQDIHATVRP